MNRGSRSATLHPTTTTMDAAGRLVIPKRIRRDAGFPPGIVLEVRIEDGQVILEPAPREVSIVQLRDFYVAEPAGGHEEVDALSAEQVEAVVRRLRERGS